MVMSCLNTCSPPWRDRLKMGEVVLEGLEIVSGSSLHCNSSFFSKDDTSHITFVFE